MKKSTYPGHDLYVDMPTHGEHVRRVQSRLKAIMFAAAKLTVDGVYGPNTAKAVEAFQHESKLAVNGIVGPGTWAKLFGERKGHAPLREHAHRVALGLIGVMEQGGNNAGPMVSKIILANGGAVGESWCGDFQAYCYRHAGSKRVTRSWAAVRLIRGLLGITATSKPQTGDLVRYDFTASGLDHVGMFECWCDAGGNPVSRSNAAFIRTIEGNTGATGAVSDSKTGGDGVYRKIRSKSLVHDYLHVRG